MTRRKPRTLGKDELELWQKVIERAKPMQPLSLKAPKAQPARKTAPAPTPEPKPRVSTFRIGERAATSLPGHDLAPPIGEQIGQAPLRMDRKRFSNLKKGRLAPEARLDLHGMTAAVAHAALTRFILDSVVEGRRLVLVITGKGKRKPDHGPIPERHGVLRHQVPHWLNTPPLAHNILQIVQAHVRHGGDGAIYVYLRRSR